MDLICDNPNLHGTGVTIDGTTYPIGPFGETPNVSDEHAEMLLGRTDTYWRRAGEPVPQPELPASPLAWMTDQDLALNASKMGVDFDPETVTREELEARVLKVMEPGPEPEPVAEPAAELAKADVEDPGAVKLPGGKYKGKTLAQVRELDEDYFSRIESYMAKFPEVVAAAHKFETS